MSTTFSLRILASDKPFYEGPCHSLHIPTLDGQREILPHHSNMIFAIVPGELRGVMPDDQTQIAAVSGGIVKVEDNTVLVLVDTVERPEEIDANRARRAEAAAREALLQKQSIQEYKNMEARLAREMNRLKISGKAR